MTDIKPGDRIELVAEVVELKGGMITLRFRRSPLVSDRDLPVEIVLAGRRIERQLSVGDRVKFKDRGQSVGELIIVHDGRAGVKWLDSPDDYTWPLLSDLERAPDQDGQP